MAFENARITSEEYVLHDLASVDKKWPMHNCSSQWTIDRDRNVHMRQISRTVPPDMGFVSPFWMMFWKSAYVQFECDVVQHATADNDWCAHKILSRLEIPAQLKCNTGEIVADIEAALTTYGTGGLHCIAKGFSLKFDVTAC